MAMDSSEQNASAEVPKVELEAITGVEFGSEKDLAKFDGIASTERELNDQDEIEGPYVIINGDSDNPSEKILKLDEKADPETASEGMVSPFPFKNASNGIGGKEVEGEVELESRSDPAEGEPLSENLSTVGSQLGEELVKKSKEGSKNEELCENKENNLEVRGCAEKELSEEIVCEEISQDKVKEQELGDTGDNNFLCAEPVVEEISREKGQECELSLAGELDTKNDTNLGMYQSDTINEEEDESKLVPESGEKGEEEHPISGTIEGTDEDEGRMDVSETVVGEQDQHGELDITSAVEEEVPQEVEQEATIVPSMEIMYEQSGALSESHALKVAEIPVSVSGDPILNLAVEADSEEKHEMQQEEPVPFLEEEIHEELQGASDSLQSNKEVEMPEFESKEQSLLDSTVRVDSEPKHEVQQVGSGPSQEDDQHEVSEGVSDSMQSNEESDTPGTEVNNQSPLDSAVIVDSEQKLGEQQEASILSQQEEMCDASREVPVQSDGKKEVRYASETDLKEIPPLLPVEPESSVVDCTIAENKIEVHDTGSTFCNGLVNGELETSPPILIEKVKDAPSPTSPDQEKLAESEAKHKSIPQEANGESETVISDTAADEETPSESAKEIEEMQNSERGDAQAVSASYGFDVDSRSVNENELVDSSSEVLADSEFKSTIEVEESDRSVTEFEDGLSKTEAETVSVSSSDFSLREMGPEDSVQIGKFKISIGENGPSILQQDLQESSVTSEAVAPDEPEASSSNGEKPEVQPLKRQPIYIMKVPRYSDEVQWEKIQEAQARLDDLTRARDVIRDIMQKRRKECADLWDEVLKAKEEDRAARAVFNAKRHEISTVQSVINKLNKANSIDDMDDLIEMKEKSLQHETMTLKQEKMLIQEIKELKAQRKKLIENMGSAAEIDEAFDQKDGVFDKLKSLKTELEVLGKTLTKAEAKTKAAQKNYDDMDLLFCSLQDEYKSADEVRQKAYLYWRDLKTELVNKNKLFFNYRDDTKRAASFMSQNPPDKEGVRLFCSRQLAVPSDMKGTETRKRGKYTPHDKPTSDFVDKLMDVWNSDAEFRKQYVNSNRNSTLRRLRTLDGRSLGPDEVPPVIPTASTAYRRTSTPLIPTTKEVRLEKSTRASSSTFIQTDEFPELTHQKAKVSHGNSTNNMGASSKDKSMDQSVVMGVVAIESAQMEKKQEEDEMERRKKEEEERARREEDIKRKAKAEAEEKERLREEQKAKAKEAEERKRRKAEKAQERAEFKARKEAETRDKKKAKKDKKKAAGGDSDNGDATNSPPSESSMPSEIAETKDVPPAAPTTATRRPTRPQAVLKQLKRVEPVPVALRNRNRRKMQSWIIGIVTAIAALLTVFLIGNYVNFSDISSLVWL